MKKHVFRKWFSFILSVIMTIVSLPLSEIKITAEEDLYSNYLEGWRVEVAWSTMSRDFEWNAEQPEQQQPKLYITYRIDNADREYQPGELMFTIQGIDAALRGGMIKAQANAADNADSLWDYTHDPLTGTYTFTNKFTVSKDKSMNGGFEFMWTLNARDDRNDFHFEASPEFSISGETNKSITLPPITYEFTSVRDRYRIDMSYSKINNKEWGLVDKDYTWYNIDNLFTVDYLARGLYRSSYYVWFDIPEDLTIDDFIFEGVEPVYDPATGHYGFYMWQDKSGDITNNSSIESFRFGVKTDKADGKTIKFNGHLSRLYNDETEWIEEAGEHECVDDSIELTIQKYSFVYNGMGYGFEKTGPSYPASPYQRRLNSVNLYNNTIIEYSLLGRSIPSYSEEDEAAAISAEEPLNEEELENAVPAIKNGPTYAEVQEERKKNNEYAIRPLVAAPGAGLVPEGGTFDMVLGDDKLAIVTGSGEIRAFRDDEYHIEYVSVPSIGDYDYEVYGAKTQDSKFEDYVLAGTGNAKAAQTIRLGEEYKAVYVLVHELNSSVDFKIKVGVSLHFDWEEQTQLDPMERVSHEDYFVNFGYIRAMYNGQSDILVGGSYAGSYGAVLEDRDRELYGDTLVRDYHNIYLRSSTTNMNTNIAMDEYKFDGKYYNSTIKATGTIQADDPGSLEKFSMYVVIPDGVSFDYNDINVNGSGLFEASGLPADLAKYVTISEDIVDGHRVLVFDFDLTQAPLEISAKTEIEIELPVYLTIPNFKTHGSLYTAYSYLTINDEGLDRITGNNLMLDEFDIDHDGSRSDYLVRSSTSRTVYQVASEWNESVSKYVESAYTDGYVTEAVTRAYKPEMSEEEAANSYYTYRLDYDLGANSAANIVFYDSIEQGADIAVEGDGKDETVNIPSEWQGTFVDVDASDLINQGGIVSYYYSEDPDMMKKSTTAQDGQKPAGLTTEGWHEVPDNDWTQIDKTKIKSIAVKMDTSDMPQGVLKAPGSVSLYIKMRAPSDEAFFDKMAVNQFSVSYTGYNLTLDESDERYSLPSNATYVTLQESVANLILQKVDADNLLRVDSNGEEIYARLTGGKFNIYDESGELVEGYEWPMSMNAMGQIVLSNIPYGTYYWEEVEAPPGYIKITGRHEIVLDSAENVIKIENHRIPGTAVLWKYDAQWADRGVNLTIGPAKYKLYKSNGQQVFTTPRYEYTEDMSGVVIGEFTPTVGISNLPWGSYYFVETEAPPGYELNEEPVYFTIGQDDYNGSAVIKHVYAYDDEKLGKIRLVKRDSQGGGFIEGAMFDLYRRMMGDERADVLVASNLKTNVMGEIEVGDLEYGYYYFKETRTAPGYEINSPDSMTVTINSYNYDKTVTVTMTNNRLRGSVQMVKKDDFGQFVPGAVYELFYKSDLSASDQYVKRGEFTTEGDDASFTVENLEWGDYYFIEKSAPGGYAVSDEKLEFTVNADNVQNQIFIEAVDERAKGKVQLVKVDKEDNEILLPGAEFDLFDISGQQMIAGEDYETDREDNRIVTDENGQVTISELKQGSYYLQETVAPGGYSKLADPIRFSVTLESSQTLQVLKVENEKGKATITINKEINEAYKEFGNPTFIFTVTNKDTGRVYTKSITLSELQLTGSVSFTVDADHEYDIYEFESTRYNLIKIGEGDNDENIIEVDLSANKAVADLTDGKDHAEVTYVNEMKQYEKESDGSNIVNIVKSKMKLTALRVTYVGPTPISDENMRYDHGYIEGYNPDTEEYTFKDDDLIIIAIYDDGTEARLTLSEVELDIPSVSGKSGNTGETITVTRTENGITVSDTFQVEIELTYSERYNIILDCTDGTTETGAKTIEENNKKAGTTFTFPDDPIYDGHDFSGWVLEGDESGKVWYRGETVTITPDMAQDGKNITFKAQWDEAHVIYYAVRIYGIEQDKYAPNADLDQAPDSLGETDYKTAGLTFGPATGKDYRNSFTKHTSANRKDDPEADITDLCIHDLSWEEIIYWSKKNPYVFSKCLETGCTHRVEIHFSTQIHRPNADITTSFKWEQVKNWSGDGVATFFRSLKDAYRRIYAGAASGGWPDSVSRNTLNGCKKEPAPSGHALLTYRQSILGGFPQELQDSIVAKVVKSDTVYNDKGGNNVTTYDRLWIPSISELYPSELLTPEENDAYMRPNEGAAYQSQKILRVAPDKTDSSKFGFEEGSTANTWTRSLYCKTVNHTSGNWYGGVLNHANGTGGNGISMGFCLPGPNESTIVGPNGNYRIYDVMPGGLAHFVQTR
ncbi:MAG: hypothetical protein J1G06_01695 [Oscillospiraceae bacterium]|nr:hypothetical protein [Oscillospiraceae bacterium]